MLSKKPTYKELEKAKEQIERQNKELIKLNETNLVLQEDSFNIYFNHLPNPMAVYGLDKDGSLIFLKVNVYMTTLIGKTPKDVIGKYFIEIFPSKKNSETHKLLLSIAKAEFQSQKIIEHYEDKNLSMWSEITFFNLGENKVGTVSFDVSKQKRAEIALEKKNKEYKMLFDSMTSYVTTIEMIYDEKGKPVDFYVCEVNQAFLELLGKTKEEVLNQKISLFINIIEEYWLKELANVDKTGEASNFENYGLEFDKYYTVSAWKIRENRIGVIFTDITERRRKEEYTTEVKLKLDKIADEFKGTQKLANIGSWIFNTVTEKAAWSDEMFAICEFEKEKETPKYEEVIKRIDKDDFELYNTSIMKAINFGTPYSIEFKIQTPNGTIKTIKSTSKTSINPEDNAVILQGINQDITKQKLFEKELIQHERLKAIGEMSSSIAHDFNNSLQGMMGNLSLIRLQSDVSSQNLKRLNNIASIITDVASRVNALQQFGDTEHHVREIESINLNTVIEESINQSRSLWKNNAEKAGLQINIITGFNVIPEINFIAGELKSAIYNIIKNSVEAMPKGGTIIIKTGIKPEGVFASFTDTGIGMNEETKLKIFQPFFSTKEFKLGRGLGMSGVYSILKKHKAEITLISSEITKGTTFEIIFPVGYQNKIEEISANTPILKDKKMFRALWVDDDHTIGEIASELVQSLGHTCDYVSSGKNALECLDVKNYGLVFTDIGMPNMNGWELVDKIRHKFGNSIKIVIVTGWDISEETKNKHTVNFILQKPFVMEELTEVFLALQ